MILRIFSISLVLSLGLILGCNKDKVPCSTCPTGGGANCEDIQKVKHFFYFKVGSWWVYEEENSGLRDSVYVTSASENPSNYDFNVEVYSTHQDYYYRYWPQLGGAVGSTCTENGIICGKCVTVFRSKYKPGDFVNQASCFLFQPNVGDKDLHFHPTIENYVHVSSVEDSIIIGLNTYSRTVVMFEDKTIMEGDQPTNHYFSENVGLVRKELLDSNEVWNLVNYYIQQ
ncbi:MAG: hypothetical protein Crog4KO_23720 [Crocinitomicaceae bacterium]